MGFTYPKPRPSWPQKTLDRYRIGGKYKCQPRNKLGSFLQVEKEAIKSLPQQTKYLPKTFNRCQGEINIVQDSMSNSEGNKKQIKRVQNCIFKFT